MTGQVVTNKALLDTLLSNLDSDAELHVEFKSPKTTLHFGTPSRLDDADATLVLKTKSGEEEEIRNVCEKALQNSVASKSVDFKGIFEEPGEKILCVEVRKFRHPGDGKVARILESDFGSQSEGRKSCGDVYEPTRLADYILQASANSLLISGQEDGHFMDIESGQVESMDYMRRQELTGSANEELLETAHAIVNMADLKPNALVPVEYQEDGVPRRRQRVAVEPKDLVGVPKECPRCKSKYVKFKYFNNKKATQPRYQCLSCKDFFTHGGKKLATDSASPSPGGSAVTPALGEAVTSLVPYQPQLESRGKERKRKAKEPSELANVEKICRKCGSKNTAFKYLNNGQQDQPRYKCLDCKGMFQLHNKRVRPSSSGDFNNATLLSDLSKEATSVESASAPHETLLMITGPRTAKQTERKRKAMEPEHLVGIPKPCPSCKKLKTRFKYFNNKNLNQPRYECLDCHSYFTYKSEFDQVRRDADGGSHQGVGISTTAAAVNEGTVVEAAVGTGQNGRGKEVEESVPGRDRTGLDGEGAMDSGDSKTRTKGGSSGPDGIGNNVSVRDTGEVINVQEGLGQVGRGEESKDSDVALEAIGLRRFLDPPRRLLDPAETLAVHDNSTGVQEQ